jgi:hypothetical protein
MPGEIKSEHLSPATPNRENRIRDTSSQYRSRSINCKKKPATKFAGAAIDTGAQRTVIGRQQALAYSRRCGSALQLTPSPSIFVFADQGCKSLGTIKISIPTPQGGLYLDVDVVEPDIPLLIGLDTLDKHGLQFLSVSNKLQSVKAGWILPVIRNRGHAYIMLHPVDP